MSRKQNEKKQTFGSSSSCSSRRRLMLFCISAEILILPLFPSLDDITLSRQPWRVSLGLYLSFSSSGLEIRDRSLHTLSYYAHCSCFLSAILILYLAIASFSLLQYASFICPPALMAVCAAVTPFESIFAKHLPERCGGEHTCCCS